MPARKESDYDTLREKIAETFNLESTAEIPETLSTLIDRILHENNKYGIVWEEKNTREHFSKMISDGYIPYITEDQKKRIVRKGNSEGNIIIEGDNFHSLKILQATHKEKIDFIYIDPPYNTGKGDFKYNDKLSNKDDTYFHSNWLAFMDKRLRLAKSLMSHDAAIFISIDENELAQLKLLCDEVFNGNYVGTLIWLSGAGGSNDKASNLSTSNEYILVYSKSAKFSFKLKDKNKSKFKDKLDYTNMAYCGKGNPRSGEIFQLVNINKQKDYKVSIRLSNGKYVHNYPSACPQSTIDSLQEIGAIVSKDGKTFYKKSFLVDEKDGVNQSNILEKLGTTKAGNQILKNMGIVLKKMYPKPIELVKHLIQMCQLPTDATILDFFAGTGTTGHAVLEINANAEDLKYKFILCTNNESQICENVLYPRIDKCINGYAYLMGLNEVDVAGLNGSVSYFRVNFFDAKKKFRKKHDLLNDTILQETYVKFLDGIITIKEGLTPPNFTYAEERFTIIKNQSKQVVIIKSQIFTDLKMLREIRAKLTDGLRLCVYYFFPNYDESDGDHTSDENFKLLIANEIGRCNPEDLHSIPKEYLKRMAKGDFDL